MGFSRGNPNTAFGRYTVPVAQISAAQNFTANWVDLGSEIDCRGYSKVGIFLKVTANNSLGMRFRLVGLQATGGTDLFPLPIKVTSSTSVTVNPEYVELASNTDQNIVFSWETENLIPYAKIQIEAGTVGATAGQIATAQVSRGY